MSAARVREMKGHGSRLGRKKEAAMAALMTHRNTEEAARAAGIGRRTLIRWLQLPEFQAAYREARRAAVSQSDARLRQASGAAVSTLWKIMLDPSTSRLGTCEAGESKSTTSKSESQLWRRLRNE